MSNDQAATVAEKLLRTFPDQDQFHGWPLRRGWREKMDIRLGGLIISQLGGIMARCCRGTAASWRETERLGGVDRRMSHRARC